MTSKQNIKTPKKGSAIDRICQYLKAKGSPASRDEIFENCNISSPSSIYDAVNKYPHLVKKIAKSLFASTDAKIDVDLYKKELGRKRPKVGILEDKVCQYLKKSPHPVKLKKIMHDCDLKQHSHSVSPCSKIPSSG